MQKHIERTRSAVGTALAMLALLVSGPGRSGAQSPLSAAGREIVAQVRVEGNTHTPRAKIFRYIKSTRPGMDFSESNVIDDVTSLINSHLVRNASATERHTDAGVVVTFWVEEAPNLIEDVIIKNVHHISAKDLEKLIPNIRRDMPLNPKANEKACWDIQDNLKRQGRYWANVNLEEGDKLTDHRVVFNVTEGPKVSVRSTEFVGNNTLASSDRLRTQILTSRAFFKMGGTFDPEMVHEDVAKLEEYYRGNGYRDVKVAHELIWSYDHSQVDIVYHIHEGDRYRVQGFDIEGVSGNRATALGSIPMLKSNDFYKEGVVTADAKNIEYWIGWRGCKAKVQTEVTVVPDAPGLVQVHYLVDETPPNTVGVVHIYGNNVTQDRVIRRILGPGLDPGQTLRYPELEIAKAKLMQSNLFEMKGEEKPKVFVLNPDAPPDEPRDIGVQVRETTTGSIMFGAGVNSNTGVMGSIVLNERNFDITRLPTSWADFTEGRAFRGAGQEFRIEAVPGTEFQRYSVSWREPFLFDSPYSLADSFYFYDRIYNEYTEERTGTRVTVAHNIDASWPEYLAKNFDGPITSFFKDNRFSVSFNVGVRAEDVNVMNLAYHDPIDYTEAQGQHLVTGPRLGVTFDSRDSFLRPTQGGYLDLGVEQLFGDNTFSLFTAKASRFFTTFERTDGSGKQVVALTSQVAWASDNTPVYERYFAGGYGSIRGFMFRGVGPQANGYQLGGDFMFLNSLEYQIPIQANDSLYAVGFIDTGTVESNVEIKNYRVAVGVGLRISIPMMGPVPIALDFGVPICFMHGDQSQLFAFSVGYFH